ncbi:GNAT family N-acetyltransferase, partial [Clostridium sp.]|uniref:GNAT family N-acetyltransferase n=1 Tax=Clostridium sp. TaxID=1506 RepID=UPI003BB1DC91
PVYHKLGFYDTNKEQIINGLRFTPMVYFILNLCAKFSLKSQPSIYGKYGKWIL